MKNNLESSSSSSSIRAAASSIDSRLFSSMQRVVSQIQVFDNESNMITDAESGMIFEMLSFDLNAKQVLVTEEDDE